MTSPEKSVISAVELPINRPFCFSSTSFCAKKVISPNLPHFKHISSLHLSSLKPSFYNRRTMAAAWFSACSSTTTVALPLISRHKLSPTIVPTSLTSICQRHLYRPHKTAETNALLSDLSTCTGSKPQHISTTLSPAIYFSQVANSRIDMVVSTIVCAPVKARQACNKALLLGFARVLHQELTAEGTSTCSCNQSIAYAGHHASNL